MSSHTSSNTNGKRSWKNRILPFLGATLTLAVVWAITAGVLKTAAEPMGLRDAKFASAERLTFFRLEPSTSVALQLPNDADQVRVVTHLLLPMGTRYQAERQYVYGVHLTVESASGAVLLQRQLYTRTRQSKGQRMGDLWVQEAAFTVNPDEQVTDVREFLVNLPPRLRGIQARMRLRYDGPQGTLLVRGYSEAVQRAGILPSGHHPQRQQQAEQKAQRVTLLPWDKLPESDQEQLLDDAWNRMGAEGKEGQDYRSIAVYQSLFRQQPEDDAQSVLEPGRAFAVNVQGPARLQLTLWRDPLEQTGGAYALTLRAISTDGSTQTWPLPVEVVGEATQVPIDLPAGVRSLQLTNTSDREVRFAFSGPTGAWFAPDALKRPGPATQPFAADLRRAEAFGAGPTCQPLEVELPADADLPARLLRIDARVLGRHGPDGQPPLLSIAALNAHGGTIHEEKIAVKADPSPFEFAEAAPLPRGRLPCEASPVQHQPDDLDLTAWPLPVSAPFSTRVFMPPGTRKVRLWSTDPVAISLYSFLQTPDGPMASKPYVDTQLTDVRWRYAPLDDHNWHPLRPMNQRVLAQDGAALSLVTQVRLEPAPPPDPATPLLEFVSLVPEGDPAFQDLLEPQAAPGDPKSPPPTRTTFSELTPGRPARVRFDSRSPTRPELSLRADDVHALGTAVELWIDGASVHRSVLRATRATELLPPVPPGDHDVELRSDAAVSALLNRSPALDGGELVTRRSYRLTGRTLRIPVKKDTEGSITVNVVLYTDQPDATLEPEVSIVVDHGEPHRRTAAFLQRITRASRTVPLPPSERPPGFLPERRKRLWHPHRIPVTLGEDLPPGLHVIEVKPLDDRPMWARFFIAGASDPTPVKQWNRGGWDGEDAP